MKVLITGGSGSLGRSLIKEYLQYPEVKLFSITNDEYQHWELEKDFDIKGYLCDIKEMARIGNVVSGIKPDVIIHAAAYKHVPFGERFPEEFYDTNVWGSYVMATIAKDYKVKKCILISTDKAVNPITKYGISKQKAENIFLSYGCSVIRFVNFWGSRGSVIPLWQEQAKTKGCIEVTDPTMERYFITLEDAAKFTIKCLNEYKPKTIWQPDNIKKWTLAELANEVCPGVEQVIIGNRGNEKQCEELG